MTPCSTRRAGVPILKGIHLSGHQKRIVEKLCILLSVLVANATGFLIYLVVPKLLVPQEFAVFSLIMAAVGLGVALAYEWARHGLIRFSCVAGDQRSAENRASLANIYLIVTLAVLVASVVYAALSNRDSHEIFAVTACVIAQGLFDGRQALARASSSNLSFSAAWCIRSVTNITFAIFASRLFGSGVAAALAFALSNFVSYVVFDRAFALTRSELAASGRARATKRAIIEISTYGGFVAISSGVSAMFPVAVRYIPSHYIGLSEVAGMMLAFDLATKVVAITGLTVNLLALQSAISAIEHYGQEAGAAQASRQFSSVLIAVVPVLVLGLFGKSYVARLIVPPAYAESFNATIGWALAAASVLTFRMYGIDMVFVLAKRGRRIFFGPLVTIIATICFSLLSVLCFGPSLRLFSISATIGTLVGAGVAMVLARRTLNFEIEVAEIVWVCIATLGLTAPLAMVVQGGSLVSFLVASITGCILYGLLLLCGNVIGLRQIFAGA